MDANGGETAAIATDRNKALRKSPGHLRNASFLGWELDLAGTSLNVSSWLGSRRTTPFPVLSTELAPAGGWLALAPANLGIVDAAQQNGDLDVKCLRKKQHG